MAGQTSAEAAEAALVPLRVHRLQHVHPPAHHVFTTPAGAPGTKDGSNGGGPLAAIASVLPHWHAVPERFFHPRHRRHKSKQQHQHGASLTTIDDSDPQDSGTALLRTGFQNPWPSFHRPSFWEVWHALRWGVAPPHFDVDMEEEIHASHRERKKLRKRAQTDPELHLSVEHPEFAHAHGTVRATWVGHAGTLLTLPPVQGRSEPFRVLFDPIFSARCSPLRGAGPLRAYDPPCALADLPPIDLVIISHNHYDHLDYDTISDLWAANESRGIRFIAPLGNKPWFVQEGLGIDPERVVELDWWDELVLGGEPILPVAEDAKAVQEKTDASKDGQEEQTEGSEPKLHAEVHIPVQPASAPAEAGESAAAATDKTEDDDLTPSIREELTPRERDALKEPLLPFMRIICTPAQHQSGRYAVDACSALWSSWVVEYHHADDGAEGQARGERRCFRTFFGGDTGYRFHDTIAAAARETEAKARQEQLEKEQRLREEAEADAEGGGVTGPGHALRKMSTKLSKRLSRRGSASPEKTTPTVSLNGVSTEENAEAGGKGVVASVVGGVSALGGAVVRFLPGTGKEGPAGENTKASSDGPQRTAPILTDVPNGRDNGFVDSPHPATLSAPNGGDASAASKASSSKSSSSSASSPVKKRRKSSSNKTAEDAARRAEEAEKKEAEDFPPCPAFMHISTELGPPNLLLLPISVGATISFLKSYDPLPPRWSPFPRVDERLTSAVHMGPEDAVRVMQLMTKEALSRIESGEQGPDSEADKARREEEEHAPPRSSHLRRYAHLCASPRAPSALQNGATALAIHWGTFVGGKDEVHQSIRALRRACGQEGVRFAREYREDDGPGSAESEGKNTFALVNHGESIVLRL